MSIPAKPVKKIIVILGPTASGKTELALKIAKSLSATASGEIISADSRQIYRGMNIGTAKPTLKQQRIIPHHLIDIIEPNKNFALSQYKKLAIKKIREIHKKNKIPFLVGGTGLYIQAIVDNLKIPQVKPNKKIREKLEKINLPTLLKQLQKLDPITAQTIDIHNKRRLIRALEVCLITKKPFSQQREKGKPLFDILQIGIKIDKKNLNRKINQRVDEMIETGLVEEVKSLVKKYSSQLPAMSGIGYREIIQYLDNKISLEYAKNLIKLHTRQYAKRQMTWFKRDKKIKWVKNYQEARKLASNFLK